MGRNLAVSTATAITRMIPPPTQTDKMRASEIVSQVKGMHGGDLSGGPKQSDSLNSLRQQQQRFDPSLPEITTIPPPGPIQPVQINTIAPMKPSPNYAKQTQSISYGTVGPPPAPYVSQDSTTTEEVPLRDADDAKTEDDAKVPPSEVERNASASLLALASTPTGLFKGLSSLFTTDRSESNTLPPVNARGISGLSTFGTSPSPPPPAVGFKKSKRSLLDDDDETEDEARLRAVPWK